MARPVSIPRRPYKGWFSGWDYPQARRLGVYHQRQPNANEQEWLDAVLDVQARLADLLPLTPRAYAYRVAGLPGFDKKIATEGMGDFLVMARRAGWIDWDTVDDSRTRTIEVPSNLHPRDLDATLVRVADRWERWRRLGQNWAPEVWVEAVGSMESVAQPARAFGAPIVSSGGTNSLTELWRLAARAADRWRRWGMQTVVLFIGDHDPKGIERLDRAEADVQCLLVDAYGIVDLILIGEWVAVTAGQITDWGLQASNDAGTHYEVEAVDPVVLRDHLTDRLQAYTSTRLLNRVVEASRAEGATRAAALQGRAS